MLNIKLRKYCLLLGVMLLLLVAILSTMSFSAKAEDSISLTAPIPDSYIYGGESWTDPAIVYKGEDVLDYLIDSRANGETRVEDTGGTETPLRETYNPTDRRWQGLVSLVKVEHRLWAAWYTGGQGEPSQFNYVVIAYSDDDGETFVDPYYIVDHPDTQQAGVSLVVPNLWIDSDGKMWLFYQQYGTWAIQFENAGAENVEDVTYQDPRRLGNFKTNQPPTAYTNEDGVIEWGFCSDSAVGSSDVSKTYLYVSTDKGISFSPKSSATTSALDARLWPESQLVELSEGNLMIASRLEGGKGNGVELAYSNDYGVTWGEYSFGHDEPFLGPGSKLFVYKLSSGNILVLNHATTSSRSELKAYLSVDNGQTYAYSMDLDTRSDVSYPYAYESDGKIYASWDKGRYIEKEMRLSIFTEDDIKNGFIANESNKMLIISQLGSVRDVASITSQFDSELYYVVGTESSTIKEDLPTQLSILNSDGNAFDITGSWSSKGYKKDEAGEYYFYFSGSMPDNVSDAREILKTKIILESVASGGCSSDIDGASIWFLFTILICLSLIYLKRKQGA